jgi:hypothetical protein
MIPVPANIIAASSRVYNNNPAAGSFVQGVAGQLGGGGAAASLANSAASAAAMPVAVPVTPQRRVMTRQYKQAILVQRSIIEVQPHASCQTNTRFTSSSSILFSLCVIFAILLVVLQSISIWLDRLPSVFTSVDLLHQQRLQAWEQR